ncbi:NAD(P)/FAD-dependent oxidoreductase [Alsobacter sp. SYSU BS001988]
MNSLNLPASLWRETAEPGVASTPLAGEQDADVAIVGAGYSGLSAALRAVERGLRPAVLEASEVGFGASGRNGGVVSTKYRVSLVDMARRHGVKTARQMSRLGHEAMDCVAGYVADLEIRAAAFAQTGNLRCAHNARALERLVAEAETARGALGDESLNVLSAGAIAEETGTDAFVGGVLNRHAGVIHPLNYARGLARSVVQKGGAIFERSPVLAIRPHGDTFELETCGGRLRAPRMVIATNAYSTVTGATGAVRGAVIPFRSAMVATEPLPPSLFETLLPHGRSYSETRRMMRWFRRVDDRVLFGGRGAFGKADSASAFAALETAMKRIFPQLADKAVTHRWSGLVAMTLDSLPQIGRLNDRAAFCVGYNGTGIAMASLLGRHALDLAFGDEPDLGLMRRPRPENIPFSFLREPAVRSVAGWYQILDQLGY